MAKVTIEIPEKFTFSTKTYIRVTDLNYGGHVGNDTILGLMHEARVRFLKHHGYEELNMEGVGIIMNDAAIVYKNELFHGDRVEIEVAAQDFSAVGFDLVYRLSDKESEKEVAIGKTGIVCFDYEKRKVARLPEAAKTKLSA